MSTSAFQLTPAERPTYAHLFALADPQSTGMVNGSAAVSFFALSGLPTPVLGSIWSIADADGNGFLGPAQFSAALRLIGHAQNGKVVTEDLAKEAGPIPTFKGISIPSHLTGSGGFQTPSRTSSTMIQPQATGGGSAAGFGTGDIKPEDRARYTRIFSGAGPQNGLLDGEKAKEIFVKSKLPFDKLGAIWNLADTKARGKLDLTDFIVGMHFIQSTMNGSLTTIPASLPVGLYERAAGALSSSPSFPSLATQNTGSLGPQLTGGSTGFISRQMTGSTPLPSGIRSPPPTIGSPLKPQRTGSMFPSTPTSTAANWAVTPTEKAKSDRFFDGLDQDRQGVLEGQAAVSFFMQSGLNETTLAHVWDLSDVTQSGSLTRDEFAVAMHLINLKITGSDLPSELPPSLIPPSLRGINLPQAVNPKETDTQRDLFSLMDDDYDLPVSTASAFAVPAQGGPVGINRSAPSTTSGPFDDDFLGSSTNGGRAASPFPSTIPTTLSPNMTGASNMGGSGRFAAPLSAQPTGRSAFQAPFADPSSDAANQRLALESTQKSLSTLETTKTDLNKNVTSDANAIADLTTRLETVRMRHQTETEAVKALTERQAAQALELKQLREESVRDESELSRLKQEKDEIEQSVLKDREDVREMKRLVAERTQEKEQLKVELEKMKKEARMQKGLVAIGKKQLNQSELELESVKQEIEGFKSRSTVEEEVQQHAEHGEVAMNGAGESKTREVLATPEVAFSPTATSRSNNPFDRMSTQGAGTAEGMAAGGLAAAAATGLGAAVMHHESIPTPHQAISTIDNDPFGAGTTSTNVATADAPEAAFDDSFGHFDAPIRSSVNAEENHSNQAFDDAFADFDEPTTTAAKDPADAPIEPDDISAAVPGSFAAAEMASPGAIADDYAEAAGKEDISTISTSTPAASSLPIASELHAAPTPSTLDEGKNLQQEEEHEESSDDEEEGPEDVESTTKRVVDSPDEMGQGKAPVESISDAYPSIISGNAPEAASRFPKLEDESILSKAPIPAMSSDVARMGAGAVSLPQTGEDSEASHTDAFHDAFGGNTPTRDETEAGTNGSSGFMNITSHDRYSTALDNGSASQRSVSPSKTRRAPPPAPIRGGTLSSVASPEMNSSPFTINTAPTTAAPIDDFDAAFEDLGPSGNELISANASTSTSTGFDDAFGDADDFDFVPSFNETNGSTFGTAIHSASTNPQSTAQTGGFDAFESTFDPAFNPSSVSTAISTSQAAPALTANNTSSGTGSGFSFEDAFGDPSPAIIAPSAVAAPTLTSSRAAPPSLPSRGPTTQSATGALPDDAAPVRQLCAMGFSRADVIKSLERSNYRTDKALERLLAQT